MDLQIVLAILIISIAFLGESIFGFAGALISVPLLSLFLGVHDAVTLVLIFQLCTGLLIFKAYKHVNWKVEKLYAAQSLVKNFSGGTLSIDRTQIIEVTTRRVIIDDPVDKIRVKAAQPEPAV